MDAVADGVGGGWQGREMEAEAEGGSAAANIESALALILDA